MAGIFLEGRPPRFFMAQGNKNSPAIKIRPAPISTPVNATVSFLINKKDNPQAMARIINIPTDCCLLVNDDMKD